MKDFTQLRITLQDLVVFQPDVFTMMLCGWYTKVRIGHSVDVLWFSFRPAIAWSMPFILAPSVPFMIDVLRVPFMGEKLERPLRLLN